MISRLRIVHVPILPQAINGHKPIGSQLIKFLMMNQRDNTKKLLLISLDGLSAEQFANLGSLGFLNEFSTSTTNFSGSVLTSPQAIWAEILSGKPWWQTGCAGYAFPKNSLNNLQIGSEASYDFNTTLADIADTIAVNIPLLEPSATRLWLSDGATSQNIVSPKELANQEPFKSYKPRPFISPAYALGNPLAGVREIIHCEKTRLSCAANLFNSNNQSSVSLIRLSAFDLFCHLLGTNYLQKTHSAHQEILSFVEFANQHLSEMIRVALSNNATICVLSAYSHMECNTRVNLNLLLAHQGYCTLMDKKQVASQLASRQNLSLAVSGKRTNAITPTPLVTVTNEFVTKSTTAASPIHGAVYINSQDRFSDGIVESAKSDREKIADYLLNRLTSIGAKDVRLELNPDRNSSQIAPDMVIYAPGLDFHDSYDAPAIDNFSHPATLHKPEGFVYLSSAVKAGALNAQSLHKSLVEMLK